MRSQPVRPLAFCVAAALAASSLCAQTTARILSPKEALGFNIGDDYQMASYTQLASWWKKLATESDRMKLETMGRTAEGRPQYMAIISSPDNIKKLDRYKEIARRLALAEGLTGEQAGCTPPRRLARSSSWRWSTRW
jgi:Zinc carboxypeptidase